MIISLGGGAFESETNRNNLSENGIVFYLKTDIETSYQRIKNDNSRPLLKCDNPKKKLEELLKIREVNYLKSDYIIETDKLSIVETAKQITDIIQTEEL